MPFHFAAGENTLDPDTNAARGLAYLALGLARASGDAGLALAGYNGGHSLIGLRQLAVAGADPALLVLGHGHLSGGPAASRRVAGLQEWLQAGGASLCAAGRRRVRVEPIARW